MSPVCDLEICKFCDIHLTRKANSLTQGLWCIGGAVGAVISGPMAAKLGRKPTLLINNFFVLTGAVLQVCNIRYVIVLYDCIYESKDQVRSYHHYSHVDDIVMLVT